MKVSVESTIVFDEFTKSYESKEMHNQIYNRLNAFTNRTTAAAQNGLQHMVKYFIQFEWLVP